MEARLIACLLFLTLIGAEEYNIHNQSKNTTDINHKINKFKEYEHIKILPNIIKILKSSETIDKEDITETKAYKEEETTVRPYTIENKAISNNTDDKLIVNTKVDIDKDELNTASSQVYSSYSVSPYEVYENVVDVADERTPVAPINPYYTKQPQLNTAGEVNKIPTTIESTTIRVRNEDIMKNKNNLLDLIHFKTEYEHDMNEYNVKCGNKVSCIFKGIKEYFSGLHKDFVNGIHSLFKQDKALDSRFIRSS